LDGLDLEVQSGEVFGFLGPNGAGKTTALKILVGLLHQTSGEAWILGQSITTVSVKQHVGFLPEAPCFYEYLTAVECLRFYGRLFGLTRETLAARIDHLLQMVGLAEARDLQLRKFSKGMLQRIGIAQALINDPQLVILDEPMSGLDPIGRKEMRDVILRMKASGKTVFFSSHILHDAELLCDRVGILRKGRLVTVGRVHELVDATATRSVEIVFDGMNPAELQALRDLATRCDVQGARVLLDCAPGQVDHVLDAIRRGKGRLISVSPQRFSLEDLFLREVGWSDHGGKA
jgi:ABC-2 type transport system ATP-binding protein